MNNEHDIDRQELIDALKLADVCIGWGDCSLENVHHTIRAAIAKAEVVG